MRLRQKLSLIVTLLTGTAILICGGLALWSLAHSNIELAVSYGRSNHEVRFHSWRSAMSKTGTQNGDSTRRSIARYYAQLYADDGTILTENGEAIFNPKQLAPDEWMELTGNHAVDLILEQDGAHLLLVGQKETIGEETYCFYELSDISEVYDNIRQTAVRFFLVGGAVILLTILLSLWLIKRTLQPLETLKQAAEQIAGGVYHQKIPVTTRDEVGELAQDFNTMAEAVERHVEELRQESERRTMLLSALTHELKTPMTGIKGNAETLLMTQMTEEEQQEALMYIDDECTRVERLSQKLMELLSLRETGALTLKTCKVSDLFSQVETSCAEQLRQRQLNLVTENHMDTIQAEPDLMVSLLLNLIDNAGKASRPGDVLLLSAEHGRISVRDFGYGIPKEELSKITQPFYMVDKSRARKAGSIGLGLALAQEIVELHGARLEIESEPGTGTTVHVIFP